MKKLLFLAGLIMVAALSSCSGNGGKTGESAADASTTKVTIDGISVEVDTFTAKHYAEYIIKDALAREEFVSKVTRPTDASAFGKKKAEAVKRAFNANVEECGTVTIVYYENGLEVIKDGKSWFYDGFPYDEFRSIRTISAAESVLHPGQWEPIHIDFLLTKSWECLYVYDGDYKGKECFYIREYKRNDLKLLEYEDFTISQKTF